jgi:hypothetical protein
VKFEEDENGVISLIATEDIAAGEEVRVTLIACIVLRVFNNRSSSMKVE